MGSRRRAYLGLMALLMSGTAEAQVDVKLRVLNDRSGLYSDLSGER